MFNMSILIEDKIIFHWLKKSLSGLMATAGNLDLTFPWQHLLDNKVRNAAIPFHAFHTIIVGSSCSWNVYQYLFKKIEYTQDQDWVLRTNSLAEAINEEWLLRKNHGPIMASRLIY